MKPEIEILEEDEVKVSAEAIRSAAEASPAAKPALVKLFPEVFKKTNEVKHGTFFVRPTPYLLKLNNDISAEFPYTAIASPRLLRAYEQDCGYQPNALKVVVLAQASNSHMTANGWSYKSWENFHDAWTVGK